MAAGFVGGPGAAALVNRGAGSLIDNGTLISQGNGPLAQMFGFGAGSPQAVERQPTDMPQYGLHVQNLGMGGQPGGYSNSPNVNTMPPVMADSFGNGFGTANVFQGGQMGAWLNGGMANRGYGSPMGSVNQRNGTQNIINDAWGEAARGFGVGGMSGGARDAPMPGPKHHLV
ncbi:hypothetical protein ACFQZQ_02965 [Lysobacter koreensis]|uniref:Uncharacterized protein n=1 Tax=Lysobacter koreensis TaxID=266122 RepID=A0ABW2YKQ9_9GAMM